MASTKGPLTNAIHGLGNSHSPEAIELLWDTFFASLCRVADSRLYTRHKRLLSAEEVAAEAFHELIAGIQKQTILDVGCRESFWRLLATIAGRIAVKKQTALDREKRGAGQIRGDSVFGDRVNGFDQLQAAMNHEHHSETLTLSCEELLEQLPDEVYRKIALSRLHGFSNREIADELNCTVRTVERKLQAIRMIWERSS